MGVITSLGQGLSDNWAALTAGVSGIHAINRFPDGRLVDPHCRHRRFHRCAGGKFRRALLCLRARTTSEALAEAGLSGDFNGPLFLAAPPIEPEWSAVSSSPTGRRPPNARAMPMTASWRLCASKADPVFHEAVLFGAISERLADRFGTRGLPVTLSTACASGATAIQLGVEAIRQGRTDRALTVATDGSVSAEALIRFSLLSALSTQNDPPEQGLQALQQGSRRFRHRRRCGDAGAGMLESAVARGARVLGIMKGCGEKADLFHRTRSSPGRRPGDRDDPRGACRCRHRRKRHRLHQCPWHLDAGERQDGIWRDVGGLRRARCVGIPVSSNKSMIGHTLTAAGAVEAVFSLQTMLTGTLPPTINYTNPDPAIVLDVVPNVKRDAQVTAVLSNSFGFGGQNASLVMTARTGLSGHGNTLSTRDAFGRRT